MEAQPLRLRKPELPLLSRLIKRASLEKKPLLLDLLLILMEARPQRQLKPELPLLSRHTKMASLGRKLKRKHQWLQATLVQ